MVVWDFLHQREDQFFCSLLSSPFFGRSFLLPQMIQWFASTCFFSDVHMDVSENRGTPKSSILIGFLIINHPFWGTPIFGNTHMLIMWIVFWLFTIISQSLPVSSSVWGGGWGYMIWFWSIICTHMYIYIYYLIYMFISIFIFVRIYIYIYIHTYINDMYIHKASLKGDTVSFGDFSIFSFLFRFYAGCFRRASPWSITERWPVSRWGGCLGGSNSYQLLSCWGGKWVLNMVI